MLSKYLYLFAIFAVVFLTLSKGDDCLVHNYDTNKLEKCTDQNLTLNSDWKEFY